MIIIKKFFSLTLGFLISLFLFPASVQAADTLGGLVTYYTINNGSEYIRSNSPFTSGIETQTKNPDGSITMSITGASGYADSGFVIYNGKLGNLNSFSLIGSGQYGLNLWFDVNSDNEYFAWNPSNVLTGLSGDSYGLGPQSVSGNLNINGSSTFFMMTPPYNTLTLDQLKGGVFSGIGSDTNVAIWVGIDVTGGSKSATVSLPAPLSVPEITWPTNNSILTSTSLTHIDWTNVTGGLAPYLYQYQAYGDADYLNSVYSSGWLSSSEIPTPGTPEGVYYVRVRAKDSLGEISDWSNGQDLPYRIFVSNSFSLTDKNSCKKDGWKGYNLFNTQLFLNQGNCVSFVQSKGK